MSQTMKVSFEIDGTHFAVHVVFSGPGDAANAVDDAARLAKNALVTRASFGQRSEEDRSDANV